MVKNLGHEIIGDEENGELGFEAYKRLKPDIVLSDIEMPVLDGYEMLCKIISFNPEAKVAIISTIANAQLLKKIQSAGAIAINSKPISEQQLQALFDF